MDFLLIKKPTITLKPHFFEQMIQYEEILRKKYAFVLSKDWHSAFFNLEDEVLTNTYLNTLQKQRKSPRASAAIEKTAPKKGNIQWNKKIKSVIPAAVLQHAEIIKCVANNKPFPSELMTESQTLNLAESAHDDDAKSVLTQKRPFKVILKSKSAKNFDERPHDSHQSFDTPGTPSLSMSGTKSTAPTELMNVYSAQKMPQRPATMGIESDQKFMRRNNSLAKDLGPKDPDVSVKPFVVKEKADTLAARPATDAEPERAKTGKVIKSELDKIKDQLNIHYGNTKSIHARIGSKSGKSLGDPLGTHSGFGLTQERTPLNQLIAGEEGHSSKDVIKGVKKGPIKSNYKLGFSTPDPAKAGRQEIKRNMFSISTHGSLSRTNRRSVQSADKQPEEKKNPSPPTHSTIRTIINTLDQRQNPISSASQTKQKIRPSKKI